ncbi:MAG: isocitrate dehydrogenase, partial [Chlamydiia bacterium]|nr:isocitrate dehydrogenase [Chlamydiia bacterium]
ETMQATLDLFAAAGVCEYVDFVPVEVGAKIVEQGEPRGITAETIRQVEDCGILFKGPMATPTGGGHKSVNVTLRKLWNTYANLRKFISLPGVSTVYSQAGRRVNFFVVRENIEDTYGGIESRVTRNVTQCKRLISGPGSEDVHRFAFETARHLGIRRVHCAHKANIMKFTDGLFLERFYTVARDYPEIEPQDIIIDALCMKLVTRPEQFCMMVLPNLQGDIVSDLGAGLIGGLGFAPSANIGRYISIFEAVHGTAPDIAGQNIANPTALMLSGVMMLRHIGLFRQAAIIENAILASLEMGIHTSDFGTTSTPALSTRAYAQAIIDRLGQVPHHGHAVAVPAQTPPTFARPIIPAHHQLNPSFANAVARVVGCDLYIDTSLEPDDLAKKLLSMSHAGPFKLTMISNRGTQVWPIGSAYTDCVDYYRVRFEVEEGKELAQNDQRPCLDLVSFIADQFTVCSYDLLRTFDGIKGYSVAQGQ